MKLRDMLNTLAKVRVGVPDSPIISVPVDTGADAAERVRAGMEMIAWSYSDDEWQRHVDACMRRPRRRLSAWSGAAAALGFAGGLGLSVLTAGAASLVAGAIGAAVGAITPVAASGVSKETIKTNRKLLMEFRMNDVLLTSTGLLYGRVARLWNGRDVRMAGIELVPGEPAYLLCRFEPGRFLAQGGNLRETLYVPVPRAVESDVAEVVELLRQRIESRQGVELADVEDVDPGGTA